MNFQRKLTLAILAGLLACTMAASATPLSLFLDRTERGLTAQSTTARVSRGGAGCRWTSPSTSTAP